MIDNLISVIVPCYNNAQFLGKCVDSILAQTFTNFEILVVDDGSEDNPTDILAAYTDPRLHDIIQLSHCGVSSARNKGIELARGEYIVFIDGDDYIAPNHLECLYKGIRRADSAMILMSIVNNEHLIDVPEKDIFVEHPMIGKSEFSLLLGRELLSSPCNKIYRTDIIKTSDIKFDSKVSYAEDLLFNLEYFRHLSNVYLIPQSTYFYVKHKSSGTTRCHSNIAYTLASISKATEKLLTYGIDNNTLAFLMAKYIWGITNLYHPASTMTVKEKIKEIGTIYHFSLYKKALGQINCVDISASLRMILKLRNSWITHFALLYRK